MQKLPRLFRHRVRKKTSLIFDRFSVVPLYRGATENRLEINEVFFQHRWTFPPPAGQVFILFFCKKNTQLFRKKFTTCFAFGEVFFTSYALAKAPKPRPTPCPAHLARWSKSDEIPEGLPVTVRDPAPALSGVRSSALHALSIMCPEPCAVRAAQGRGCRGTVVAVGSYNRGSGDAL